MSIQQEHFQRIHDDYSAHYFDGPSMAYRERFIFAPMFAGLDLAGKTVAELACGAGFNSLEVRRRYGARVFGCDISEPACLAYRSVVGAPAYQVDLTAGVAPSQADVAFVIGGLHHCAHALPSTLATIGGMLPAGGRLIVCEPNVNSALQVVREFWYRRDRYFDETSEMALSPEMIHEASAGAFRVDLVRYMGGPAYFLIFNSLILRVPRGVKPLLAAPLFALEGAYNRLPGQRPFPYFIARFTKL